MKISEISSCTGLSKDTIRYYEKFGLIHPKIKKHHRDYNEQDIEVIEIIVKLKDTGFSLKEIKMLLDWSKDTDENKEMTNEEIQNLKQIKEVFQNKQMQMIQKEEQIKKIKQVLLRAENKIQYLLEKNKRMNTNH
ncbi:MerR family transcriptional regulator [Virgibacillus sp. MSP4-1]|uniref:helix-turn-helix domain-containing protein n=1 Tax=Virgibacillus sp. MSP4-1 TaxID=2700081 RepID=UPI00039F0F52|nr:MerR family transcriptional regulator [Virgibacillus sp. MSP4-1]QHS23798.1 MerR family transcriptional regulator [Virgibacillus sp. MSP4-1]